MQTNQNNPFKVCILSAGIGSRVGDVTKIINKGILPINNKAVISHIIEKFPVDTEIIIAVGHKKETVIDYVTLAHPDRTITFVEVDHYTGTGSGPGYSLLACKEYLQCPFIFYTSDTMVVESIPGLEKNWIGVAPVDDTESYCTVRVADGMVTHLDDKIKTNNEFAFIGLAGIRNYQEFFRALEQNKKLRNNELQMIDGFNGLLDRDLVSAPFTWFDTGTKEKYREAEEYFSDDNKKFDFSKGDEFLYFVGDQVIKFFADINVTQKRHQRSLDALRGLVPEITECRGNFYAYQMVPGQTFYRSINSDIFSEFLTWAESYLWKRKNLSSDEQELFDRACFDFYQTKTEKRTTSLFQKINITPEPEYINGVKVAPLHEIIKKIDWNWITKGVPSGFHGDLQFDNIIITENVEQKFVLIDWRQDFGGLTDFGDLYYDLAKLYGGMIISYPLIKENKFTCSLQDNELNYEFAIPAELENARNRYEAFLQEKGFDLEKVRIITAIIFINMAPLHHEPFNLMLYGLGRSMLSKLIKL